MEVLDLDYYLLLQIEVPLPPPVQDLLDRICREQSQTPPEFEVRQKLASAGEDEALRVLGIIAGSTIKKSLSGFVVRLLERTSPPSTPPKRPRLSESPNSGVAVQYFAPPQGAIEAVADTLFPESPRGSGEAEMEALGELEFRKQFLILNYIGSNELHRVLMADEIRDLKDLQMVEFEKRLWVRFGGICANPQDRVAYSDWDRKRTHIYHCHVSTEGRYTFKGPYLERTKTHLQRVLGDDNVLLVKFAEEKTGNSCVASRHPCYAGYSRIAREGISVGLRRYRFFVFKDGGKEDGVKCFFVRIHSDARIDQNSSYSLSNRTISEARRMFMHVHTVPSVAKYMARFSLILSKTFSLLDKDFLSSVKMKIFDDISCRDEHGDLIYKDGKPLIHTDGTGYISEDLAVLCPNNIHEGICTSNKDIEIIHGPDEHADSVEEKGRQGIETQAPVCG